MSYQQKNKHADEISQERREERERTEDDGLLMIPVSNKRRPVAKETEKELLQ